MLYFEHMTKNTGYQITEKDIETTMNFLKSQGKPATREDAIKHLEEKAATAHLIAHKLVEDEKSGNIKPMDTQK